MKKTKLLFLAMSGIVAAVVTLVACSKSGGDSPGTNSPTVDSVLVNTGSNIILPSYQLFKVNVDAMDAAVVAFNAGPTLTTLTSLQNAFKEAYKTWASCSEFDFGPASDLSMNTHFINSFPTDTVTIKNNIAGATYVIDGLGNYAAQGFPAIDYLLFAYGSNAALARFTSDAHAAGAKQYLAALSTTLKTKASAVVTAWSSSGGNYVSRFNTTTGVDAGSSLSLFVNGYVRDFDITLQNYKIGIPIGLYGPNVLPKSPDKVEAYYSALSVQILIAQVQAYQKIYTGSSGNGYGLEDKVIASHAQYNGISLNDAIKNQMTTLLTKIQALPDPLSTGVQNNSTAINDAYTEVRKMTVLLKVDMCSALGVRISFQDDDGD